MKWGIITDTHNKTDLIRLSISTFEDIGCGHIFHCGDFTEDHIATLFMGRRFNFHCVTDHSSHDKRMKNNFADVIDEYIESKWVYVFHGTYPCMRPDHDKKVEMVKEAIRSGAYDFVFYGHLHYFNLKFPSQS